VLFLQSSYKSQLNAEQRAARELLKVVVKAKETLAADRPPRLASQHALAGAYRADGQVQEAIDLLERVVETRVLHVDYPSLLVPVDTLADMRVELAVESDEAPSCASVESPTIAASVGADVQQCG
jgi:hypothetical protein